MLPRVLMCNFCADDAYMTCEKCYRLVCKEHAIIVNPRTAHDTVQCPDCAELDRQGKANRIMKELGLEPEEETASA